MAKIPRVILLLSPHAGYDRGILQGIVRYARVHGPWIFGLAGEDGLPMPEIEAVSVAPLNTSQGGKRSRVRLPDPRAWGATGIIGRLPGPEIVKVALSSGLPVVAMDLSDRQLAELPQVSEIHPDSQRAGRLAAEHLLGRGLKSFGYCGYEGRTWSERRRQGFCERLQEVGLSCDVYRPRREMPLVWQRERAAVTAWLRGLPKPAGVMACNDIRGRQVIEAGMLGKMPVPDALAVVGVDDDLLLCELSNPPLSSVTFDAEQGGYEAAELLDGLMRAPCTHGRRRKEPQRIVVEAQWVVSRKSSDMLAIEDGEVAAALRFIREHGREPIGVKDVVKQVALSRRTLEVRFGRLLGRSIREEIQQVRLVWVKQLLIQTNLPAIKIADRSGFNSLSYLSKVFRHETGETLNHYRRRRRSS